MYSTATSLEMRSKNIVELCFYEGRNYFLSFFIFLSRGHLVRGHFLWVPTLDFLAGWQLATGTESFMGVPTMAKLLNEKTSQNKNF